MCYSTYVSKTVCWVRFLLYFKKKTNILSMRIISKLTLLMIVIASMNSCVSKKKFTNLQEQYGMMESELNKCQEAEVVYAKRLDACEKDRDNMKTTLATSNTSLTLRQEQLEDMRVQLADMKMLRDKQLSQVGDLTVLSQTANNNISETLAQLETKEKYVRLLQSAKTKADSINLALAVNLKTVLKNGIEDSDIEVQVDKTVVYINLSDKMLYQAGSSKLTPRSKEVLGKIAKIIESRPNLEVMVEGYTDTDPISNSCIKDNWDLSVKRATSVVRVLQKDYGVDPNKLIAAGRGQYNPISANDTSANKSKNRRTRIIILPKLGEFYDLLNPDMAPK